MKIRLIFTEKCERNCFGCCNKYFDFTKEDSWDWIWAENPNVDEVMISGGEPMLYPNEVYAFISRIRQLEYTNLLLLYTAHVIEYDAINNMFRTGLDGLTLTLHTQSDVGAFESFNNNLLSEEIFDKSLRLNVFKGVKLSDDPLPLWKTKRNIEWVKNCPLPKDETLMVLR